MKLSLKLKDYRVKPEAKVDLADWPTEIQPLYESKTHYRELLEESRGELGDLQNVLYAHNRYALLLLFQGMDTAGKGGAIKHVMSGVNPQGCQVFSFAQPSAEELDHDFLWRTNRCLPERGRIGIFDRSYYEEVLVVRVVPGVLERQRLPAELVDRDRIWRERFGDIVNLEAYLRRNGTRVVKFFLHISKEEQRQRLLARIDQPHKNWKITRADIESRGLWDDYQEAYAECLGATSSEHAPWLVVPADDKRNARLIVAQAVVEALQGLEMEYPKASEEHLEELRELRQVLESDPKR
ncbi:MAG: polyphosphate kinase 2 family protein [Chromatiaceae bacterium]|jgi:PPK2 family polyphosphate:nucleotide phosphotransferase|nr:polyphosphate kinase 2 family protein [Chromatiaceae bacterium]